MIAELLLVFLLGPVTRVQKILAVQEGSGYAVLFSAADPSIRERIKVGDKPHEVEITPDGRTAFISNFGLLEANKKQGTPGTTISVLDIDHATERTRFHLPPGITAPHGLKLRPPAYHELYTNAEEGRESMVVFDARAGKVLRTFPLPPGVHNFVFNREGSALFAFTIPGEVCRIDPETGSVTAHTQIGSPRGLAWTADGNRLIVGAKNELVFLDPKDLSVVKRFGDLGVGQIFYPAATPDGRWLLAPAVLDSTLLIIDTATGQVAHRVNTGSPLAIALAADGRHAWVSNVLVPEGLFGPSTKARSGGLTVLDLSTFQAAAVPGLDDTNGLAITP